MIKNIIFDMGNVLIYFKPLDYFKNYLSDKEAQYLFDQLILSEIWEQFDLGFINILEVLTYVKNNLPLYFDIVEGAIDDIFKEVKNIDGMDEVVKSLKDKGYATYILSNAHQMFHSYKHQIACIDYFDGVVLSGEEHVLKPDHKIYNILLKRYHLNANECVFIDDSKVNIEAAIQLGFQGIVFHDVTSCKKSLEEILKITL